MGEVETVRPEKEAKMRRMWILTVAACVLSTLFGIGQDIFAWQEAGEAPPTAQQARPARGRAERELQRMAARLDLTEEQKAKIRPILQERNKQLDDLRANFSLPQGEARAKAREIRKSARHQINQILTPEQREKERTLRRGNRPKGSGQSGQASQSQ
jgi:Spy/CpxP family protein refolding chaperone